MTDALLIDLSPYCPQRPSCWPALADAGDPWAGVVLRGGNGLRDDGQWVREHSAAIHDAGLPLGLYWYLRLRSDGAEQADRFADLIDEVQPTLLPIVDVEEGDGNADIVHRLGPERGRAHVEQVTRAFTARILERTGQTSILYAGGWLRGIRPRELGCDLLWLAAYTSTLPRVWYEQDLDYEGRLWAWQYAGLDARGVHCELAGYPRTTPIGDADISAVVGGLERAR